MYSLEVIVFIKTNPIKGVITLGEFQRQISETLTREGHHSVRYMHAVVGKFTNIYFGI